MRSRHLVVAVALLVVILLACQIGPKGTSTVEPTPTERVLPRLQTPTGTVVAQVATATRPPTASVQATAPTVRPSSTQAAPSPTPTATLPAPTRESPATPALQPTPTPRLPDVGPLPAVWTKIDLGLQVGNVYYPGSLAYDAKTGLAYALGSCGPPTRYAEMSPLSCLATLDLESGQLLRVVEVPGGSDNKILLAGDTTYLYPPWSGTVHVLDSASLSRGQVFARQTIPDVLAITYDGRETTYVVTKEGLARLSPDPVERPYTFSYDDTPFDMQATAEGIVILGYHSMRLFSSELAPIASFDMADKSPRALALDAPNERVYVGGTTGLYVLDLGTLNLSEVPVRDESGDPIQNIERLIAGPAGERLYALVRQPADWFGGTVALEVALESRTARTLFATLEGRIADLFLDQDQDRLFLVSYGDHALIPIDLESRRVAPRLPMGIEVGEVIVDPAGDRLYVSDSGGWVHVLDRRTYDELDRIYGGRYISLDATRHRLYAGDPRVPALSAFDATPSTAGLGALLWEAPQPGKPRAYPAADQVVVLNRRFYLLDGSTGQPAGVWQPQIGQPAEECLGCYYPIATEAFIDARSGVTATTSYTPWPGKPSNSESIDVDPASGRTYYSLLTGGYVRYSSVAIYADLGALQARQQPVLRLEGLSGEIKVDPSARRLYVARGHILFVLDSETLNRVGRVQTSGWQPQIVAIDDELGRLYSARDQELVVWTRQGGAAQPAPEPPEPATITRTVASILPSPNYVQDRTLLATINERLCRSTDGGETWQRLRGGLPVLGDYEPKASAAFSPDYASDRTIFVGLSLGETHGEGVYCSDDGGNTWAMCSDGLYDLRVYRVEPSPNFAQDRTLLAYARTERGESLHRSTDGGKSWSPILRQVSYGTPSLPEPEDVFLIADPLPRFRCDYSGSEGITCQRSSDSGKTWRPLDTANFHMARLVDYVLSPDFAVDHTAYWLTESALFRYNDHAGVGEIGTAPGVYGPRDYTNAFASVAVTCIEPGRYLLFLGTHSGEFMRFDADDQGWEKVWPLLEALPPPTPTPCAHTVDPRLTVAPLILDELGCAIAAGQELWVAVQPFEKGTMLWRRDATPQGSQGTVYVLAQDRTWAGYEDTWVEDQPERDPELVPPVGLYQPVRGFGKVWREALGGPDARIGWATALERGVMGIVQRFEHGQLVQVADGPTYVLYDGGAWETARD